MGDTLQSVLKCPPLQKKFTAYLHTAAQLNALRYDIKTSILVQQLHLLRVDIVDDISAGERRYTLHVHQ